MRSRWQQWVGVVVLGIVIAVGYIRNSNNNGSLLASVVGDYGYSSVGYVIHNDQNSIDIIGEQGGESTLTIMMLYDADRVQLDEIETAYHYVLEDDDTGLIRIQLEQLPVTWDETSLVRLTWDGALESVVVSDIGFDMGGTFRTIPVSNNSLCFGNECEHDA